MTDLRIQLADTISALTDAAPLTPQRESTLRYAQTNPGREEQQ